MASLLLHVCCAHCGAFPIQHWQGEGYSVVPFWYNPNIHPYLEHLQRYEAVCALAASRGLELVSVEGYDFAAYFRAVVNREEDRCRWCFQLRLRRAAAAARERRLDALPSTKQISPQQKHDRRREVADEVATEAGVPFLYADLRKHYSDSRHITKPMGLYRQQYCGCIYSEWDRYGRAPH